MCDCCCSKKLKLDVWFNTAFIEGDTLVIEKLGVDKLKKDFDHEKVGAGLVAVSLVEAFAHRGRGVCFVSCVVG